MASRDLKLCVQELQEKVPLIIETYNKTFPERELRIICTLRSTEEQQRLFAIGRTTPPIGKKYWVTKVDGVKVFSKHNPTPTESLSRAVDFGVFIGGKYITNINYYYPLLTFAREQELISGLDFKNTGLPLDKLLKQKTFKDAPHIEVKGSYYKEK